jgi:hypothetical protein
MRLTSRPLSMTSVALEAMLDDETQRYQLCHYDVLMAQLVALGFIKSV